MATDRFLRVALYARVSTTDKQDVTMQLNELRMYCERRGWTITEEYVDVGVSGAKDRRPRLDQLMSDAHQRRFDAVVVWKFDRFARSTRHLLNALETFRALGVDFVSYSEQLDTSTPMGKMIFTVLGAVGELERSLIVERVRAGVRHARSKGKRLGRPKVDANTAQIADLRARGASWSTICAETGLSAGTAKRAFYNLSKNPIESASVSA